MKRSKTKFSKPVPKMFWGGLFNQGAKGAGMANMFNQGASAFSVSGSQDSQAMQDIQMYGGSVLKNKQTADQIGTGVESAVGSFGPWGAAIAGASKIAGKAFGADEYGDYKDNAGGVAKEFFNRSLNMKEGIAGLQDTLKRPTLGNITSQLSLGLIGKSERERDAEKIKKTADIMRTNIARRDMATQGAINLNRYNPGYKAPAYGKKGMKFKTKYSKSC